MTMLADRAAVVTGAAGASAFATTQLLAREGTRAVFKLLAPSLSTTLLTLPFRKTKGTGR